MGRKMKSFFSKKPDHYKIGDELDLLNDNCGVDVDKAPGQLQLFLGNSEDYVSCLFFLRLEMKGYFILFSSVLIISMRH